MKFIKNTLLILSLPLFVACSIFQPKPENFTQTYTVNLNDRSEDTFKVTLDIKGLKQENNIFQFASTAPGTYQVMDIGRFVKNFQAFDKDGNPIEITKLSVNQYQFSSVIDLAKISYEVSETWDTPVEENPIYAMCGTSIEEDHVLINGQGVFGYFHGLQSSPIEIEINYPESWLAGTAMSKTESGMYYAPTYDYLVDSPILLGKLTRASKMVEETEVEVYTYSKTGLIESEEVLKDMNDMLFAASKFVNGLPVDRYTFLYLFEDRTAGAWEHSYSSEYIYTEGPWEQIGQGVVETAAHEFFHVITPLNIHSEIIQAFNFVTPIPSQHLWLYEGTTEWASHMMLLQDNLTSLEDYLEMLHNKVSTDESFYRADYSLVDLSLNSYSKDGQTQYGNIYMRGALVAGLLDLKLLELSNGEMGLKDLVNTLAKTYGPRIPFDEASFFQEVTNRTYPEIGEFIENYIQNANPLPYKELYEVVGIDFQKEITYTDQSSLNLNLYPIQQGLYVISDYGDFKRGDFILKIDDTQVNNSNYTEFFESYAKNAPGKETKLTIYRSNSPMELTVLSEAKVVKNQFVLMENANPEQLKMRNTWLGK